MKPLVGAGSKSALLPRMKLNQFGDIILLIWNDLSNHIPGVELGQFILMANHIHGIVIILFTEGDRAGLEPAPTLFGHFKESLTYSSGFQAVKLSK